MSRRWFGGGSRWWPLPKGGSRGTGLFGAHRGASRLWAPGRGRGAAPHRPTFVSSLVAALLAVGVVLGFVVARTTGPSVPSRGNALPTTSAPAVPSTSLPSRVAGTTTVPTTAPPQSASATPSGSPGPGPCTPSEVVISTATDSSSYGPGSTVTVTTLVRGVQACVFQPVAVGPYSCADTVVITDAGGTQAWPWPGQAEQCSPPSATVLEPGVTDSLRAAWNGWVYSGGSPQQAPPGVYQAVGTWAWSAGAGRAPYEVSTRSQPFTMR